VRRKKPSVTAIIPARLASTRFPGKVLADETGLPMVVHVCQRVAMASAVGRVVVATDSDEIVRAVESHGFEAVLTHPDHPNGTSRLAQAAAVLKLKANAMVVNVQGDEPEIESQVIDGAVEAHFSSTVIDAAADISAGGGERFQWVGTVASPIRDEAEAENTNVVKVALGVANAETRVAPALYFSRAGVPFDRDGTGGIVRYRHVGVYAYGVSALRHYTKLRETPCERAERLEQLRWLEHGYPIAVAVRESSHAGIDTPEQYAAFVERWRAGRSPDSTKA